MKLKGVKVVYEITGQYDIAAIIADPSDSRHQQVYR